MKMYERQDIKNDAIFQDFILARQIIKKTVDRYITALVHYSNSTQMLPEQFIEEAEDEQDQGIKRRKRKIRKHFIKYIQYLEDQGFSPQTINSYLNNIKAIYNENEVDPPKIYYKSPKDRNPSLDQLPTIQDIKTALNQGNSRDKALVLLHLSSGMGAAELRTLKYIDFINALNEYGVTANMAFNEIRKKIRDENAVGTWNIRRVKTGMPYITFSTPEANEAILDYIAWRAVENNPIGTKEDYLFVTRNGKPLAQHYHAMIFQRLNDKAGFGRKENNVRLFTSHQLRKLFTTTLFAQGMDKLMVDWMLGHKINDVTEAYFKTKPERLRSEYIKHMDHLTLEQIKIRKVTSGEVKELVRELDAKESRIKELEKKTDLMDVMMKKMMEKQFNKG